MDVTPQVINEVEFHQKMRGYDPDEVDDFLERVALAVGQLQDRIRESAERALQAERRAGELEARLRELVARPPAEAAAAAPVAAPATSPDEDAERVKRMIVIAQRTADEAIAEARDEARRRVAEAEEQARTIVADAEVAARATADDTRQRLVAEIIALEETRDGLRADQGILERHLDEQRLRLRSAIADLQRVVDDPGRLRQAPAPQLPERPRPAFLEDELRPAPEEAEAVAPEPAPEPEAASQDDEVIDLAAPPVSVDPRPSGGVVFTAPDDEAAPARPSAGTGAGPEGNEDAWARFTEGGPRTESLRLGDGEDAYLTELRKAMVSGGSEGAIAGYDDDFQPRPRFGRRR